MGALTLARAQDNQLPSVGPLRALRAGMASALRVATRLVAGSRVPAGIRSFAAGPIYLIETFKVYVVAVRPVLTIESK